MGDLRSSTQYPESTRRRRQPNELVWTQPRTLPAFLHKNARSFSAMPEEGGASSSSSSKESKARKQPGRHKWHQGSISKPAPPTSQAEHVFDWNVDADFLDLASACDVTDDSMNGGANSMHHTSTSLDTPYLTTPQSMDQNPFALHADVGYIGGLDPLLGDNDDLTAQLAAMPDFSLSPTGFNGFSAIHLAAHFGKLSVVQQLLSACPEALDLLNKDAETPLHIAVTEGHSEVVLELLRSGANTSSQDANGRTPLHLAVLKEQLDMVRLLLEHTNGQGMIRLTDYAGHTALHQAVLQGCGQIIQLLLEKGADPRMPVSKTGGVNI